MMVRSSRVDQPPVSGVPVAGATVSRRDVSTGFYKLLTACIDKLKRGS
jgi:hypothetical protein